MNPVNLLNVKDVDAYVRRVVRKENQSTWIGKWYGSTFRRWLIADHSRAVQLVDVRVTRSVQFKMVQAMYEATRAQNITASVDWRIVDPSSFTEEWQQAALDSNTLYEWIPPTEEETNKFFHWQEFMGTLPDRQIKYTVEEMQKAVAHADALAKRRDLIATTDGVEFLPFVFDDPSLYIVRLESKGSFANESRLMDHCVGRSNRYFDNRRKNPIFSLRSTTVDSDTYETRTDKPVVGDTHPPLATIEVDLAGRRVIQVRGFLDRPPSPQILTMLGTWLVDQGFTFNRKAKKAAFEDAGDDEFIDEDGDPVEGDYEDYVDDENDREARFDEDWL